MVASVLLHGIGMYLVQRRFARAWPRDPDARVRRQLVFGSLVAMMLAMHLLEIAMWAVALVATGALQGFRDAYYYASVTYVALGYEEGILPRNWRLIAPYIAMSGLFAFGWTTGVLVSLVQRSDEAIKRDIHGERVQGNDAVGPADRGPNGRGSR